MITALIEIRRNKLDFEAHGSLPADKLEEEILNRIYAKMDELGRELAADPRFHDFKRTVTQRGGGRPT